MCFSAVKAKNNRCVSTDKTLSPAVAVSTALNASTAWGNVRDVGIVRNNLRYYLYSDISNVLYHC